MKYRVFRVGKPLLVLAMAGVLGWVVMLLWNAVIPAVLIGGRTIDYWHAVGVLVLCRILFGGFRGHGGRHRHWRRQSMTPAEREKFGAAFTAGDERGEERS